jgi:hypothetical protein
VHKETKSISLISLDEAQILCHSRMNGSVAAYMEISLCGQKTQKPAAVILKRSHK